MANTAGVPHGKTRLPGAAANPADQGVQAYLEGLFRQRYFRDLDDDENVVRSLPFYATALAATFTAMAVAAPIVRQDPWQTRLPILAAFAMVALLIVTSMACLMMALVRFGMLEVSTEADILAMASQTADEVARVMLRADEAERDEVTLARVRAYMIAEYARVAEVNRGKNHARKTWRNRAFLTLAGALLMTFGGLVARFALGG